MRQGRGRKEGLGVTTKSQVTLLPQWVFSAGVRRSNKKVDDEPPVSETKGNKDTELQGTGGVLQWGSQREERGDSVVERGETTR